MKFCLSNFLQRVTMVLEEGRSVTTDNFFTSVSTAEFLLPQNITLTGTLKANKSDIPAMIKAAKDRAFLSLKFIFSDRLAVISFVLKKIKLFAYFPPNFLMIHNRIKVTRSPSYSLNTTAPKVEWTTQIS